MTLIDPQTIESVGSAAWWPVAEFTGIAFVSILTYLGIHSAFTHIKPATKTLISMFIGVMAYSLGKFLLLILFTQPLFDAF